jgi:hypothetical protein
VGSEAQVGLNMDAEVFDTVSRADFVLADAHADHVVTLISVTLLPNNHHRTFFVRYCQLPSV